MKRKNGIDKKEWILDMDQDTTGDGKMGIASDATVSTTLNFDRSRNTSQRRRCSKGLAACWLVFTDGKRNRGAVV